MLLASVPIWASCDTATTQPRPTEQSRQELVVAQKQAEPLPETHEAANPNPLAHAAIDFAPASNLPQYPSSSMGHQGFKPRVESGEPMFEKQKGGKELAMLPIAPVAAAIDVAAARGRYQQYSAQWEAVKEQYGAPGSKESERARSQLKQAILGE